MNIDKRKKIYNSAKKLFEKFWPVKVSIDAIVNEAWVGKWTFYNYFQNKQELYEKIIEDLVGFRKKYLEDLKNFFWWKTQQETLVYCFVWFLSTLEENIFLKNIFLENKNFFMWKINLSYVKEKQKEAIWEIISWLENEEEKNFFLDLAYSYAKLMLLKKNFLTEEEYKKTMVNYANIFAIWFLNKKNFIEIDCTNF